MKNPFSRRTSSCRGTSKNAEPDNDNDSDNALREVQHLSMEAWPYRRECRGHDPAKKRICCTDETCSIGKVCTYTLLRTVCSTSEPVTTGKVRACTSCKNMKPVQTSRRKTQMGCRRSGREKRGSTRTTSLLVHGSAKLNAGHLQD